MVFTFKSKRLLRDDSNNNVCNTPTSRDTSGITVEISSGRTGSVLDCKLGFFEFPISGIPSNVAVTNVDFEFSMYGVSNPRNCDYVDLGTVRPSTASDSDLFAEILLDNDYTDNDSTCAVDTGSTQSVTLGGNANSDVESSISNGVFYFGVKYNDLTVPSSISESTFSSEEGTITETSPESASIVPGSQEDLIVNVGDRVFFNYDSSDLDSDAQELLQDQVAWLKQYSDVSVIVEGHCDERGTREYNLALGEKRAQSVKNYLISLGISSDRISTISYGKERPAVVGSNDGAWAQNRRSVTVVN